MAISVSGEALALNSSSAGRGSSPKMSPSPRPKAASPAQTATTSSTSACSKRLHHSPTVGLIAIVAMCLLLAGCGSHAPRPTAAVVIREALGRQPGPPHRNRYSQLRVSLGAAYYVGTVLKTTNGRWGNEPTSYTYQWQRCNELGKACANITGETRKRYK